MGTGSGLQAATRLADSKSAEPAEVVYGSQCCQQTQRESQKCQRETQVPALLDHDWGEEALRTDALGRREDPELGRQWSQGHRPEPSHAPLTPSEEGVRGPVACDLSL